MASSSSTTPHSVTDYTRHPHVQTFENDEAFTLWLETTASKHVTWIISKKTKNSYNEDVVYYACRHACKPQKKNLKTPEDKRRQVKPSIKVGCPARLNVVKQNSGSVFIKYFWRHEYHDPYTAVFQSRVGRKRRSVKEQVVERNADDKSVRVATFVEETQKYTDLLKKGVEKIPTISHDDIDLAGLGELVKSLEKSVALIEKIGRPGQTDLSRQT
ncbi:hypothetical protein EDC94DRAFT_621814 [Helicostylum pulchrum]|nr:hypothetical protein EDC94DRAFT_621814 [Helicostylum pulchrum]